jgi:hypothetical protein
MAFRRALALLADESAWTTQRHTLVHTLFQALELHGVEMQVLLMAGIARARAQAGDRVVDSVKLSYSTSAFEADSDVRFFVAPPRWLRQRRKRVGIVFESDFWTCELWENSVVSVCAWPARSALQSC